MMRGEGASPQLPHQNKYLYPRGTHAISKGWQMGHQVRSLKMTEKIDPREVYGDDGIHIDCDCKMERACTE